MNKEYFSSRTELMKKINQKIIERNQELTDWLHINKESHNERKWKYEKVDVIDFTEKTLINSSKLSKIIAQHIEA